MSFVHGHGRDTTWVRSHHRAPHRPEDAQLELADREWADPDHAAADVVLPARPAAPDDLLSEVTRSGR